MTESNLPTFIDIDGATNESPKKFTKGVATSEYVSGGYYDQKVNRVLSKTTSKLLTKFGDAIVDEMLRDAEIRKCDTVLKISVLNDGVTFYPALSKPAKIEPLPEGVVATEEQKQERLTRELEIKRYEQAEKYADFVTRSVNNLDTPLVNILENMLDALTYGNKVAEQTYKEVYDKSFGRRVFTLDSVRVKPRSKTRFVVDNYNKLVGFATQGLVGGKPKTVILPREKFWVLTFRGKDGDPRGQSILEPVYLAWHLKMQVWPEYLRWLLQCALPSLVGVAAPVGEGNSVALRDASTGQLLRDESGNVIYESQVSSLLNALVNLRNASAIAVPHGATVTPINNSVSGDPFKGMIDVLNGEIEMGMILQTLATSEGKYMSRAASQSHMSILDLFVFYIKGLVINMLLNDFVKPLMLLNFPNFDMSLLPKISMGDSERRDWATDALAIAALMNAGFIGESQKVGYDKILSAPERDVASDRISEGLVPPSANANAGNQDGNSSQASYENIVSLLEAYHKQLTKV